MFQTHYNFLHRDIKAIKKKVIHKYQNEIKEIVFYFDPDDFDQFKHSVKKIIYKENDYLSKQIIIYEIHLQLKYKILMNWECYVEIFQNELNFYTEENTNLPHVIEEIASKIAEKYLYFYVYDIAGKIKQSKKTFSKLSTTEKENSIEGTKFLLKRRLSMYHDKELEIDLEKHINNLCITQNKVKIFKILNDLDDIIYYDERDSRIFIALIFEMLTFYYEHRRMIKDDTFKALKAFNNALKNVGYPKEKLFHNEGLEIIDLIDKVRYNQLIAYTIYYFSNKLNLDKKKITNIWKVLEDTDDIQQTLIQIPHAPLLKLENIKIGIPFISLENAIKKVC